MDSYNRSKATCCDSVANVCMCIHSFKFNIVRTIPIYLCKLGLERTWKHQTLEVHASF